MNNFHSLEPEMLSIKERYHLMTAAIVPRPIALVTSLNSAGTVLNAAPFSYFNGVSTEPPLIMLGLAAKKQGDEFINKDSTRNILDTCQFVINICTVSMSQIVTQCSEPLPPDVSEVERYGLETLPGTHQNVPRLACSPVHLECRLFQSIPLGPVNSTLILGEILVIHVQNDLWQNNRLNTEALNPLARLEGGNFGEIGKRFL